MIQCSSRRGEVHSEDADTDLDADADARQNLLA